MKRFAKKGLSLLLAVIMLLSTLPMNAMAAMVMDPEGSERVEVPTLDRTDHVVDTMAGPISDGSERPERPTPGGDESGELGGASSVSISAGTGNNLIEGTMIGDDSLTVLVLPDFKFTSSSGESSLAGAVGTTPGALVTMFGIAANNIQWNQIVETTVNGENVTWPHVYYRWQNISTVAGATTNFYIDKNGNFGITNGMVRTNVASHGSVNSLTTGLVAFADTYKDTIYINGAKWNGTDPLPFKMYAITSGTVVDIQDLELTVGASKLKVSIAPVAFQTPLNWAGAFAEVTIVAVEDMDVDIYLYSDKLTAVTSPAVEQTAYTMKNISFSNSAVNVGDGVRSGVHLTANVPVKYQIYKVGAAGNVAGGSWANSSAYSYTVKAVNVSDAAVTDSDTALLKILNGQYTPMIQLIYSGTTNVTQSMDPHEVKVKYGATELTATWNATVNAYVTSQINAGTPAEIYVDGVNTGMQVNLSMPTVTAGSITNGRMAEVPVYRVTTGVTGSLSTGKSVSTSLVVGGAASAYSSIYWPINATGRFTATSDASFIWDSTSDVAPNTVTNPADMVITQDTYALALYEGATYEASLITAYKGTSSAVSANITYTITLVDTTDSSAKLTKSDAKATVAQSKWTWKLAEGKDYKIYVNEQDTGLIFKSTDATKVVNLGRVTKTEVGGDTTASYIVLPWDGETDTNKVPSTSVPKRGDLTYTYPENAAITVDVSHKKAGDALIGLEDNQDSSLSVTNTTFTVVKDDQTVTATYGFTGSVCVFEGYSKSAIYGHKTDLGNNLFYVKEGDYPTDTSKRGFFTKGTATNEEHIYTADLPYGTYNVYLNGFKVGQIKNGSATLNVNGRVVTVNQGTLATTGDDGVAGISATAGPTYIPKDKTIAIAGTNPGGGKTFDKWTEELAESSGTTKDLTGKGETDTYTITLPSSGTEAATSKTVTLTAVYKVGAGDVTITVNKNGTAEAGHTVKINTANTLDGNEKSLTDQGDGTYTDSVTPGTYYVFVDGTLATATAMGASDNTVTVAGGSPAAAEVNLYTVTYEWGSGYTTTATLPTQAVKMPGDSVTVDTTITTSTVATDASGLYYTFMQWSITAPASGTSISSGTFTVPSNAVTLTAEWDPVMLDVVYVLNNGTEHATKPTTGATKKVQKGGTYTIDAGDPTRIGYTFTGWSTGTTGGQTTAVTGLKESGKVNSVTANLTLTAQWEQGESSIVYDWNYTGSTNVTHKGLTGVPDANVPTSHTRTGYTWDGKWYEEPGCTTEVTSFKFPAKIDDTVTYYANWTENDVTVTFHPESGTWGSSYGGSGVQGTSNNYAMTGKYTAVLTAPTSANISRSGYTFGGWAESKGGAVATVPGTFGAAKADYYAIWTAEARDLVITVNKDGSPASGVNVEVKQGATTEGTGNTNTSGQYTVSVTPADPNGTDYDVYVDGDKVDTIHVDPGDTKPSGTYSYFTLEVTTDGNGTAGITTAAATIGAKSATAESTNSYKASIVVLSGESATWSYGTANTDYEKDQWDSSASYANIIANAAKDLTHNATYKKQKVTLTAYLRLNGSNWTSGAPAKTITIGDSTNMESVGAISIAGGTTYSGTVTVDKDSAATACNVYIKSGNGASATYIDTGETVSLAASNTINVDYYEAVGNVAASNAHGDVKVEYVSDGEYVGTLGTDTTDWANSDSSATIIVLKGSKVTWTATPDTNYVVSGWTPAESGNPTTVTVSNISARTPKTVAFGKDKFDTVLKITLNGVEVTDAGAGKDITDISLTTTGTGAATYALGTDVTYVSGSGWKVAGAPNSVSGGNWTVTTSDGWTTNATMVKDSTATVTLFSVEILPGAGGNNITTNKPTFTKLGSVSTDPARVIRTANTATSAIQLNALGGYSQSDWLGGIAASAPTLSAWASTCGTKPSGSPITYTVPSNAATNCTDGKGIYIQPTYTYEVTVNTVYGTPATALSVDKIELKETGTTTSAGSATSVSTKSFTGLSVGNTYDVYVNGYRAGSTTVSESDITNGVTVTMYKISMKDDPTGGASSGSMKVDGKAAVYLPAGATETSGLALAATADSNYRDAATKFTIENGDGNDIAEISSGKVITSSGKTMTKDVTVTAHFVRQRVVDAKMDSSKGTNTTIQVAAGSTGSVLASTTASKTDLTGNKIDDGDYMSITTVPEPGKQLDYWTVTGTCTVYDNNAASGTTLTPDSTTNKVTSTNNYITVVPTGDDKVVVTAFYKAGTYEAAITVKLDNGVYTGRTVELRSKKATGGTNYTLPETGTGTGVYTLKVLADTYDIYVDGVKTGTVADTEKDLTVSYVDEPFTKTVNYYTVDLVTSPTPIAAAEGVFVDHNATVRTTGRETSIIMLAKESSENTTRVAATGTNKGVSGATTHYQFASWGVTAPTSNGGSMTSTTSATPSYKLPKEGDLTGNTNIDATHHITLTATFDKYYAVTLAPPVLTDTSMALGVVAKATFGSTGNYESNYSLDNRTLWVKAGTSMAISNLALKTDADKYIFAKWTQTGATAGTFANSGTASDGADTFTPGADTVLTPNYWRKPTLTPIDSYHQNFATNASVDNDKWGTATYTKGSNTLPEFEWTKNSATATATDGTELEICEDGTNWKTLNVAASAGTGVDVVRTVDGDGNVTYIFQRDYLLTLVVAAPATSKQFGIRVKSNTPDTSTTNHDGTTLEAVLEIAVNPDPLTKVDIQVKDGATGTASATANVDVATRNGVIYKTHTPTTIDKNNQLTYTWYYGPTAPTQKAYSLKIAANNAGNISDATADLPADKTVISGVTGPTLDVTNTAYKGMYIYAVVAASNTGYGAAITNSIPVDYDATVTVQKDGKNVDSDNTNYEVYLLPKDNSNAAGYATMPGTAKGTTWNATNKNFETTNSALTGGVTYDVYVNKVEGNTSYYVKTGETVKPTSQSATVDFYSVNAVPTIVKDAYDNSTPMAKSVGETFQASDKPTTVFTTAGASSGTITVASGKGVFKGSAVTAKTSQGTFGQDYHVDWGVTTTEPTGGLSYNPEADKQDKATAAGNGIPVTNSIEAKTWAGAQLDQNLYTVTGNIWAMGNNNNAGIKDPTLTANGHVFNGTVTSNGKHKGTVTFTVPFSSVTGEINEDYKLEAKPFDGTETGLGTTSITTLRKYAQYTNVTSLNSPADDATVDGKPALTDDKIAKVTGNNTGAFTIVVTASKWKLTVADDGAGTTANIKTTYQELSGKTTSQPPATSVTAQFSEKYATRPSDVAYLVNLTNDETTDLTVTLALTRQVKSGNNWGTATTVDLTALTGGKYTDTNGITIADLPAAPFDLLAGTSLAKKYTVTIPKDMDITEVRYNFAFTSVDKNTAGVYGPSVTYTLEVKVEPRAVTAVSASASGKTLTASGLQIDNAVPTNGVSVNTTDNASGDVVYEWYAVPYGSTVGLNTTSGMLTLSGTAQTPIGSGISYTATAAEAGKDIYVVARGAGMSGNVTSAAKSAAVTMPYDLDIIVKENATDVAAANKGNYKVYLVPNTVSDPDFDADLAAQGIVEAKNTKTLTDGAYTAEGLIPGTTYKIYTNAVGGTADNWQDSKVTAALANFTTANNLPVVTYRNVILSNTTVNNQHYNAAITADSTAFLATYTGATPYDTARTDNLKAPTAKVGSTDVATDDVDKWVQSGTKIDLTYTAWTKDYTLTWGGKVSGDATDPTADATKTGVTVNAEDFTIDTELKLNLYEFKLWVAGKGTITEGKLTNKGTGLSFTSKADGTGVWNGTGGVQGNISEDNSYTFNVPAGSYEASAVVADGVTLLGYGKPHGGTYTPGNNPAKVDVTISADTGDDKDADVVLSATGRAMTVGDNAGGLSSVVQTGTTVSSLSGTARYVATATDATVNQEITLPYGYSQATLTLTVTNTGNEAADVIYQVNMDASGKHSSNLIKVAGPTAPAILLDGTANMNLSDATTATVTIDPGLAVSDTGYVSALVFSYNADDGDTAKTAKVTYNLTIKVAPAEFTAVTMTGQDASGNVVLNQDLEPLQYETAKTNLFGVTGTNAIVEGTDYTYKWYATPADKTLTGSWSAGVFTPDTGASATELTPKTGTYVLEGATIAAHPGEKIWLVVTAENDKNVVKYAISDPVTTGFQPVVKISVDGTDITTKPDDGHYVVTITDDSDASKTWKTVWNDTAKGFVPVADDGSTLVSLDASKSYIVKTNKYQGDTDTTLVAHGTKLSNASASDRTVTVPFFTVNAVETRDFEAIPGQGETFDTTNPLPTMEFALGGNAIADKTPVLSGQNVTAKITAAWSQDYKLTWHTQTDGTVPDPDDNAYENTAATGNNKTMTAKGSKQTAAEAIADDASGNVAVNGKTYIGGRLDQNFYTITATVTGNGSLAAVDAWKSGDSANKITGTHTDNDNDIKISSGDTVVFTVVAGDYDVSATRGSGTNIVSIQWESETPVLDNTLSGKTVAKNPDKDNYDVLITIESADLNLAVSDDKTTPNVASAASGESKEVVNSEVRYFSGIPADDKLALSLTNAGNLDLATTMTVYHFDKLADVPEYDAVTKWGSTATGYLASAPAAVGDLADTLFQNGGRQVITVTGVMANGTTVAAKAGQPGGPAAVSAGTITIGTGAFNKDDGVYVFRFVGDDDDADTDNPVVYYVLDLTIKPLPIKAVEAEAAVTGAPGENDKVQLKGATDGTTGGFENVTVNNGTADVAADTVDDPELVDNTDVTYQWVRTASEMTAADVKAAMKVDATTGAISSTSANVKLLSGNGANSKQYTVQAADLNGYLYLVAYAPGDEVNASERAVSEAIKTKQTVGVQVSLDGIVQPNSGTTDPGYVIYLVEDGKPFDADHTDGSTGTWATTWSGNTDKLYQAAIDGDNILYHVYAPSFKGGSNYVDTALTVGKNVTDTPVVPYFTVDHTTNVAVNSTYDGFAAYLPNGNASNKADNQIQNALTVAVSDDRNSTDYTKGTVLSAASVPVLKDMNVKVTVDATATSNNADTTGKVKKSWSEATELHTMTTKGWEPGTATSATTTEKPGVTYPAATGAEGEEQYLIQSGNIAVTEKKGFSATLRQVLFEVTFVVKDNTPDGTNKGEVVPRIDGATLKTDKAKETATEAASFSKMASSITNGTTAEALGTQGADGATVTFQNIPAGAFEIVAVGGEKTNVDGYTWNAEGAALDDPKDPGAIVNVTVPGTPDNNKHAGNTIQIQYSSNAIRWFDNFNTADGTTLPDPAVVDGPEFVPNNGFKKVDTAKTGPFLALKEGYDDSNSTLTYKVRVKNTGANSLPDFQIIPDAGAQANLTVDLTQVTVYDVDGNAKSGTVDVSQAGFDFPVGETLEFEVTIPDGKTASSTPYSGVFDVQISTQEAIAGGKYSPDYQVKPNVVFDPGNAVVLYGDDKFDGTPVDIAPSATWDTAAYKPDFEYSVLTEEELTDYLDGATRDANVYTKDGKTGGESKLPDWLVLDKDTGVVTFKPGLYATEVNVQVKGTPEDFDAYDLDANGHKVNNEIVFCIKAVDQDTNEVYYTTYTVDVEPGQLAIVDGDFTYTTDEAVGGLSVDRSKFTYTKVTNMADAPLDVVPAAVAPDVNTGVGNDPSQETPTNGKVFVNDGTDNVHTATWTVDPDKYVSEVATDYVFKVSYKPDEPTEKWNYRPDTYRENIEARKPDMSLKFADAIDNATKVVRGDTYTDLDGEEKTGLNGDVPVKLDYVEKAKRLGESITYLDDEPIYTVKIQKIGAIYGMKLVEDDGTKGFQVVDAQGKPTDLPTFGKTDTDENEDLTLTVKLSEIRAGLWAGKHEISFTATGYSSEDLAKEGGEPDVEATYELTLIVRKKVIPEAHVSELTEPVKFDMPDTDVTVTIPDSLEDLLDEDGKDKYGNKPIDTVTVEHDPGEDDEPYEPSTDYKTVVTLEANPNYTFEDKAPEGEEPNYTAGDTAEEGYPDGGYDVELTQDDPTKPEAGKNTKVTFTKETKTAEAILDLKFNDTDPDDAKDALDAHAWSDAYENKRVKVYYLDQIPDFYDVYLQNPGTEDLYNVALTVKSNTGDRLDGKTGNDRIGILSASGAIQFNAAQSTSAFTSLSKIAADTAADDHQVKAFKADLRNLKYAGTYILEVHATGTTTKPTQQASLLAADGNTAKAKYTLIVEIVPRPIVVANVTGLGAAEVDQKVSDNVSKIEVKGQVLYRGDESIDGANKDNVSAKSDVDLINKGEDTEKGPENGLDVNGLKRLDYQLKWYELDESGNSTELSADPETGDTFKPGTAYRVVLKLIPDPNYTFVRVSTEEHQYEMDEEDFFYFDPTDNGNNTGVSEDNQRIGEEQIEYNMTVTTITGEKTTVPLNPEKDNADPNAPIIIEKEQKGKIAQLKFDDVNAAAATDTTGPAVDDKRTVSVTKGSKPGVYHINLGAYFDKVSQVTVVDQEPDLEVSGTLAERQSTTDPETGETVYTNNWTLKRLNEPHDDLLTVTEAGEPVNKNTWELDLSGLDTSKEGSGVFVLKLTAKGLCTRDELGLETELVQATYTLTLNIITPGGGGGGGSAPCPNQVSFLLGLYGTTNDPVMEMVSNRGKVKVVPGVTAVDGYKFLGWSQSAPTGDLEKDAKRELVKPEDVVIQSDVTFYAVYEPDYRLGRPYHEHYVIGYPNGNFGPADNINRASVATIIARAVLPNFVEGADYGNPGGYSDVSGHWAASAIAYCSKYGVFQGYDDGTFRPDQFITRQELALVMARLSGIQSAQEMPFIDLDEAGDWAMDGIYTAYANGWVNGYVDGTFKPLANIRRDETVKIFNAYLYRGVNEEGLGKLVEYVHSGVASNVTENGTTEYMTWPDVTKDQWAYYEIIEAANDHEYVQDASLKKGYTVPETWDKCWIDEKWRYHDDLSDGGPTMGLLSAGFRVWTR